MSLSNQKAKDAAMAAYMKARGIRRTSLACAICHRTVGIDGYENHLVTCKGR
jgi:hypothetical protein